MNLPFAQNQFLENFAKYNEAVFPMQFALIALALGAVFLAIKNNSYSSKIISGILAFFWLWMGIVYHIVFFSTINKGAILFGSLFVVQGILFIAYGIIKDKIQFNFQWDGYSETGLVFVTYALLVYPILGYIFGHTYPSNPTFGLPCPTTIFTFGILLIAIKPLNKLLFVVPFIWSLIGFSASLTLGIKEDTGLLVAGVLTGIMLIRYKQKTR